jgi:hypothetical protein
MHKMPVYDFVVDDGVVELSLSSIASLARFPMKVLRFTHNALTGGVCVVGSRTAVVGRMRFCVATSVLTLHRARRRHDTYQPRTE